MSALGNQTNINPTRSFFAPANSSNGGGSNFPSGLNVGTPSVYFGNSNTTEWSVPILSVGDNNSNAQNTVPLAGRYFFSYFYGSNATDQKSGRYSFDEIVYQGNNGSGFATVFLQVNDSNLNNTNADLSFQLTGVSSIQAGTFIVNAEHLCSTIVGNNWG